MQATALTPKRVHICSVCRSPIKRAPSAYRIRKLKVDGIPGCQRCRYLRRLPQPGQGNTLGRLLFERIRSSGMRSLTAWARQHGIPAITVRQIMTGERQWLSTQTIGKLATTFTLPESTIAAMLVGSMETKHREQGRALGLKPWTAERRRQHGEALRPTQDRRGWAVAWQRNRERMLQLSRQTLAAVDRQGPAYRVAQRLGTWRFRHDQAMTPDLLDALARRWSGTDKQHDLPYRYVRFNLYRLAGFRWSNPSRPEVERFELVYPLKRREATWTGISHALGGGLDSEALQRWWRLFWNLPKEQSKPH